MHAIRSIAALATWAWLAGTSAGVQAQDMAGNNETARRALHVCATCHGEGGRSASPAFPALAGQPAMYTARQLRDFRAQQRAETDAKAYMWGVSALLDDATIDALAEHYAAQTPLAGRHAKVPAAALSLGRQIFEQGIPKEGIRACASCHGDKAEGAAGFPRLAGQHATYLASQIKLFGTRLRPHGVLMKAETANMTPARTQAVAAYLQSL